MARGWRSTASGRRAVGHICSAGKKRHYAKFTACAEPPKRWGLFGENDQEHINNISLGIIDLIYPRHWQPWIAQDLGHKTDIDIYLDRHVVRRGRYLSLHDEVKNFPLQHWLRSAVIAGGAALIFVMLLLFVPLDMPIKFTLSWIKGAQTVEATSVQQLEEAGVRVGDTLRLKGTGMCNIHTPGASEHAPELAVRAVRLLSDHLE